MIDKILLGPKIFTFSRILSSDFFFTIIHNKIIYKINIYNIFNIIYQEFFVHMYVYMYCLDFMKKYLVLLCVILSDNLYSTSSLFFMFY